MKVIMNNVTFWLEINHRIEQGGLAIFHVFKHWKGGRGRPKKYRKYKCSYFILYHTSKYINRIPIGYLNLFRTWSFNNN